MESHGRRSVCDRTELHLVRSDLRDACQETVRYQAVPRGGPLGVLCDGSPETLAQDRARKPNVLVVTDLFSKLTRSIPHRTTTASVVANWLLDNWVYVYGAPRFVLADNGPQIAAKLFDAICALLRVRNYLTADYHPQSNGQTERFDRTLVKSLRSYVE